MADGAVVTGKRTAQLLGAWIVFEDEAGQDLKPGKGRTWSRRGRTPLVRVTGKGSGRVLMAGMICVRPGRETRLIYRTQSYRGRTGEKKGFRAREFADLLTSARRQLGDAPLIVVWDNASTHHAKALREFCCPSSPPRPSCVPLPDVAGGSSASGHTRREGRCGVRTRGSWWAGGQTAAPGALE